MGDEIEMVDAADDEIAPRGMIDLPNEILGKILNQLRPKKERGKVRLLSRRYKEIFEYMGSNIHKIIKITEF